jgi:hypothetical protein
LVDFRGPGIVLSDETGLFEGRERYHETVLSEHKSSVRRARSGVERSGKARIGADRRGKRMKMEGEGAIVYGS